MNYANFIDFNSKAWFDRHAEHVIGLDNAKYDSTMRQGALPSLPWSLLRKFIAEVSSTPDCPFPALGSV